MRYLAARVLATLFLVPASDAAETALEVGMKAPSFTLKDQDGKDRSLADLVKKGKIALVFHRSARW